jgi:NAD(P)-dependent dehydrogenase (short-subunit alcohol dehydrogenase family)
MPAETQTQTPTGQRVALVTGASYGVGADIAKALARDGWAVALTATRAENLAATVAEIAAAGGLAVPLALDLRSQAQIQGAVAQTLAALGSIDALVNNAAANLRRDALEVTRAEWDEVLAINLTGSFFLTQQIGRHLIARRAGGSITSIASTHGLVGAAQRSTYGITKAGIIQMTRMLAIEWADFGIRVNAVAPGRLQTASPSRATTGADRDYMQAMLRRIPLHRLATSAEVASMVAFLAGPAAASMTGQAIVMDGGITAA